jgi:hypothetical protein
MPLLQHFFLVALGAGVLPCGVTESMGERL